MTVQRRLFLGEVGLITTPLEVFIGDPGPFTLEQNFSAHLAHISSPHLATSSDQHLLRTRFSRFRRSLQQRISEELGAVGDLGAAALAAGSAPDDEHESENNDARKGSGDEGSTTASGTTPPGTAASQATPGPPKAMANMVIEETHPN